MIGRTDVQALLLASNDPENLAMHLPQHVFDSEVYDLLVLQTRHGSSGRGLEDQNQISQSTRKIGSRLTAKGGAC